MFKGLTVSFILACHLHQLLQYLTVQLSLAELSSWELSKTDGAEDSGKMVSGKHQELVSPPRRQSQQWTLSWGHAVSLEKKKVIGSLVFTSARGKPMKLHSHSRFRVALWETQAANTGAEKSTFLWQKI